MLASWLFSMLTIITVHKLKKNHSNLSMYLNVMAIYSMIQHMIYALSAFSVGVKGLIMGHDFCHLWLIGNINPIIAAVTLICGSVDY